MDDIKGAPQLRKRLANMSDGEKFLAMLQTKVTKAAKDNTRPFSKTRNLSRSIEPGYLNDHEAIVVVRAKYGVYVEMGTGLYGPKKRPIVPRTKKALAFHSTAKGGALGASYRLSGRMSAASSRKLGAKGDMVVVKSVKGRPATPFLGPAVAEVAKGEGLKSIGIELWNEGA